MVEDKSNIEIICRVPFVFDILIISCGKRYRCSRRAFAMNASISAMLRGRAAVIHLTLSGVISMSRRCD